MLNLNYSKNNLNKNLINYYKSLHNYYLYLFLDQIRYSSVVFLDYEARILPKQLVNFLTFFKNHSLILQQTCIDIVVYDKPGKFYRFTVVYYLLSVFFNSRIRVVVETNELLGLLSITKLYKSANWSEREVWDLYGIFIVGNTDLRRILTDYGFEGHPLRKDFPLSGFKELVYNETKKFINYYNIQLMQVFYKRANY